MPLSFKQIEGRLPKFHALLRLTHEFVCGFDDGYVDNLHFEPPLKAHGRRSHEFDRSAASQDLSSLMIREN